jgi:hypothetical protein
LLSAGFRTMREIRISNLPKAIGQAFECAPEREDSWAATSL